MTQPAPAAPAAPAPAAATAPAAPSTTNLAASQDPKNARPEPVSTSTPGGTPSTPAPVAGESGQAPAAPGSAETTEGQEGQQTETQPFTDETPIDLGGGEVVPLADLKQAWAFLDEVAELKKSNDALKGNLTKTLEALGGDDPGPVLLDIFAAKRNGDRGAAYEALVKFATDVVNDFVAWENMTAEQKQAIQYKAEADALRADAERKKRQDEEATRASREQAAFTEWSKKINDAAAAAGLSGEADIEAIAELVLKGREVGIKVEPAAAAAKVKAKREADRKAALVGLKPEEIPPETAEAMRKARIEEVKGARSAPSSPDERSGSRVVKLPKRPDFARY